MCWFLVEHTANHPFCGWGDELINCHNWAVQEMMMHRSCDLVDMWPEGLQSPKLVITLVKSIAWQMSTVFRDQDSGPSEISVLISRHCCACVLQALTSSCGMAWLRAERKEIISVFQQKAASCTDDAGRCKVSAEWLGTRVPVVEKRWNGTVSQKNETEEHFPQILQQWVHFKASLCILQGPAWLHTCLENDSFLSCSQWPAEVQEWRRVLGDKGCAKDSSQSASEDHSPDAHLLLHDRVTVQWQKEMWVPPLYLPQGYWRLPHSTLGLPQVPWTASWMLLIGNQLESNTMV